MHQRIKSLEPTQEQKDKEFIPDITDQSDIDERQKFDEPQEPEDGLSEESEDFSKGKLVFGPPKVIYQEKSNEMIYSFALNPHNVSLCFFQIWKSLTHLCRAISLLWPVVAD